MCLEDESINVKVAALRLMQQCPLIEKEPLVPLADSENKRIRAAAVAVLANHGIEDKEKWFRVGLTDPCPCVRVETARLLYELDPTAHKDLFKIALHDPNADVARRAERLTKGKGYAKWRK